MYKRQVPVVDRPAAQCRQDYFHDSARSIHTQHGPQHLVVDEAAEVRRGLEILFLRPDQPVRSDVEGYAGYIEQSVAEHGGFSANDPTLATSFDENPPTRREAYCREIGRPFFIMVFQQEAD